MPVRLHIDPRSSCSMVGRPVFRPVTPKPMPCNGGCIVRGTSLERSMDLMIILESFRYYM